MIVRKIKMFEYAIEVLKAGIMDIDESLVSGSWRFGKEPKKKWIKDKLELQQVIKILERGEK